MKRHAASLIATIATVAVGAPCFLVAISLIANDSAWWPLPALVFVACAWSAAARLDDGARP